MGQTEGRNARYIQRVAPLFSQGLLRSYPRGGSGVVGEVYRATPRIDFFKS